MPASFPGHGLLLALLLAGAHLTPLTSASDVQPPAPGDGQGRRVEAWLYGNVVKYAYYYADLLVGSPNPQRTSVIVDTGSHLIGFPCKGCVRCGDHLDPAFDFSRSKSAEWLNCSSHCDDCTDGDCRYQVRYSEGSGVSGRWFEDVVHFEGPSGRGPPVRARMGCHLKESNLFLTQRADGIMGLAPAAVVSGLNSHRTILEDLFHDEEYVNSSVFSLCFSTWGGRLMLGGHDPSYHSGGGATTDAKAAAAASGSIQWLRMKPNLYYIVYPTGLLMDGLVIAAGQAAFGLTIVDSGTTFSSFPGPIYHNLINDLNTYCNLHNCGEKEGLECWRLSGMLTGPRDFPTLRMQFGGDGEIDWPPHAYMHQSGGRPDLWCYSFEEGRGIETVLGISWMIHKDVIFDLQQQRLGVVHTICPEKGRPAAYIEEVSVASGKLEPAAQSSTSVLRPQRRLPAAAAAAALLLLATLGASVVLALRKRHASTRWPRGASLARELSRGPSPEEAEEEEANSAEFGFD